MALVTVHHGQIAGRSVFLVSTEIFAPHIHDPQALRLHILIILEFLQDTGCTPCQCVFTVTEHSRQLIREQVADLAPQLGIAGVKHTLCANGIRILVAITQGQSALVVVALCGIVVVVKAEIPMDKITRMREYILCTVIDHGVALCKQVVIQCRVHDKIVFKVRLKLLVTRIHDPVLHTDPRILRSLYFLFGASLVDVAELKAVVAVPSLLRKITVQESGLLIGIVIDLNDNLFMVIRVHAHRIVVFLRVANITAGIEMPFPVMEHGAVLNIRLLYKDNTRVEGHRVAHLRVVLACLANVRVKLIEIICQQRVVRVFRRCNIDFDIKVILRHTVFR